MKRHRSLFAVSDYRVGSYHILLFVRCIDEVHIQAFFRIGKMNDGLFYIIVFQGFGFM